jgi:formyltetrahydrofolate deformylase
LFELGCNILDSQQFGDEETGQFFLRVHFDLPAAVAADDLRGRLNTLSADYGMDLKLHDARRKERLLIMVSKQGHCLNDLLFRVHSGHLHAEVAAIVSNHNDYAALAASYGIPFHYLPVTAETKAEQEKQVLKIVEQSNTDLVVLARYMQILSADMCRALNGRAINIHHSFLPSFKGARPYHQAHARGVKIIGATAHYVTSDLDEGPIIDQDIERVDHTMTAQDLTQVGSDIESLVLSRAVRSHVEHRILLNRNKTVVFR